jgi:hypothetical protein
MSTKPVRFDPNADSANRLWRLARLTGAAFSDTAIGSGVLVGPNWLLTANHVVGSEENAIARCVSFDLTDGFEAKARRTFCFGPFEDEAPNVQQRFYARISGSSLDFSLIRIESFDLPNGDEKIFERARLTARLDPLTLEEPLTIFGHDPKYRLKHVVAGATFLGIDPKDGMLQVGSERLPPGFSGGPVFDRHDQLVGIVTESDDHGGRVVPIVPILSQLRDQGFDFAQTPLLPKPSNEVIANFGDTTFLKQKNFVRQFVEAPVLMFGTLKEWFSRAERDSERRRGAVTEHIVNHDGDRVYPPAPGEPQHRVQGSGLSEAHQSIVLLLPRKDARNRATPRSSVHHGSGFMVGPKWCLTAHHVVMSQSHAKNFLCVQNFLGDGSTQESVDAAWTQRKVLEFDFSRKFLFSADGIFDINCHEYNLDFALIPLADRSNVKRFTPCALSNSSESNLAVQIPWFSAHTFISGVTKQLRARLSPLQYIVRKPNTDPTPGEGQILKIEDSLILHHANSAGGASGAPIIASHDQTVVGLHCRSSYTPRDMRSFGGTDPMSLGEGTTLTAVAKAVQVQAPDILEECPVLYDALNSLQS